MIAVDGVIGLTAAAKDVVHVLAAANIPRGVSAWDASGVFTELLADNGGVQRPSARTLTLLYAADLAFRLRWQIVPALDDQRFVIAAPYVETAKALGVAAGLPRKWLDELFRFAPRPDSSYLVTRSQTRTGSASQGYFDCFSSTVLGTNREVQSSDLMKRSLTYLASLERRRRLLRLSPAVLSKVSRRR